MQNSARIAGLHCCRISAMHKKQVPHAYPFFMPLRRFYAFAVTRLESDLLFRVFVLTGNRTGLEQGIA